MTNKFKAVIFDFDYTLADSSLGIAECINFALKELGFDAVEPEIAFQTIGLSLPNTFIRLVGEKHIDNKENFSKLFVKRADEVMVEMTSFFENVPVTLKCLKEKGLKLGIVSTKFRYRIESILEKHGYSGLFDIIVGSEDVKEHKPHPEGLNMAIEALNLSHAEVLYIGDSVVDAETAERAGVPFAAVLSGVTKYEDFTSYRYFRILKDFDELLLILDVDKR